MRSPAQFHELDWIQEGEEWLEVPKELTSSVVRYTAILPAPKRSWDEGLRRILVEAPLLNLTVAFVVTWIVFFQLDLTYLNHSLQNITDYVDKINGWVWSGYDVFPLDKWNIKLW